MIELLGETLRIEDMVVIGEIAKRVYNDNINDGVYKQHSKMKNGVVVEITYEVANGDLFITNIM